MRILIALYFIVTLLITIYIYFYSQYSIFKLFLFSLVSNGYLIFSLSKKLSSFHIFMSFFLWMGFWIKFLIAYFFFNMNFYELGNYVNDSNHIDQVFFISTIGISGFFTSALINYFFLNFDAFQKKMISKMKGLIFLFLKKKK